MAVTKPGIFNMHNVSSTSDLQYIRRWMMDLSDLICWVIIILKGLQIVAYLHCCCCMFTVRDRKKYLWNFLWQHHLLLHVSQKNILGQS